MSEYQYYEFRAIDRSLTEREMRELREISSRAQITPVSFINVYNYGDFRGDPEELMEQYFDAFLYYANWGTRQLMFRLPRRLVDVERASAYCLGEGAALHVKDEAVILEFIFSAEEPDEFIDKEEGETLSSLIPLRADLLAGDWRALYLGWLLSIEMAELDDEVTEPPVPAGLGELTEALESFAEYLRIDEHLIAVAAERSPPLQRSQPTRKEWAAWIHSLPESEKEALLLRVVADEEPHLRGELLQRFQREVADDSSRGEMTIAPPRTVGELLAAAEQRGEEQRRLAAEQEAAERARYLEGLRKREPGLWRQVDELIDAKRPKEYDQAVTLLADLRDLSMWLKREPEFAARIGALLQSHRTKVGLLQRLNRVGL
jgi:hypothetical protein